MHVQVSKFWEGFQSSILLPDLDFDAPPLEWTPQRYLLPDL